MTDAAYLAQEFWSKVEHGSPDSICVLWHRWRSFARKERDR